jgi:hypothetical protein
VNCLVPGWVAVLAKALEKTWARIIPAVAIAASDAKSANLCMAVFPCWSKNVRPTAVLSRLSNLFSPCAEWHHNSPPREVIRTRTLTRTLRSFRLANNAKTNKNR